MCLARAECFLNALTPTSQDKFDSTAPLELSISDVFSVPFVGCVVSGVILAGTVKAGDPVLIGVSTALRDQHGFWDGPVDTADVLLSPIRSAPSSLPASVASSGNESA